MLTNLESNMKSYIKSLNEDIALFPQITPITPDMNITFQGVSRTVMLDRYAFKDIKRETVKIGDLVVLTYKDHPQYPSRGYGFITDIKETGEVTVVLDEQFEGGMTIETSMEEIDKPLEIFYEQICDRVARGISEVEKTESKREESRKAFYDILVNRSFVPAGRVLMGAGSKQGVTYFNCFVTPFIHDSRGGISDHRKQVMEIMSRGGGVGTNGSTLRPRNTICHGVNGRSSGSVSWLHDLSQLTNLVEQGGSRRGAQMLMLADWHPDIVEFIVSKIQNPKVLQFIAKNTKSKLIKSEVERKLNFTPLSDSERTILQYYADHISREIENGTVIKEGAKKAFNEALELLEDGGRYGVYDPTFLSGANISVCITKEFMQAVEDGSSYSLRFPDIQNYDQEMKEIYDQKWHEIGDVRRWEEMGYPVKTYYEIDAKELWDLINTAATYSAEPGVFFIDNANDMTNATAYGQQVVATNPCGEQPLSPWSVCNLAAINLSVMVNDNGQIDWDKLKHTVRTGVRMQDNIIDATPYFLKENKEQAKGERRIGMGVMGLHDLLLLAGVAYGSTEGNKLVDQLFETIAITAYEESIELAKEKGEFPFLSIFEDGRERFINTGYMKRMPHHIREGVLKYGIRNSHLLTVAPTGSTGTMMNVSTGLEPYFNFLYYRSGRLGKFIPVVADIAQKWLRENGYEITEENAEELVQLLPDFYKGAMDLSPEEHVETQCIIQRWVDSSLSKTVNAPKGYSVREVEKVYEMLYKGGAKGGTVYVDGSRDAQVLTLTKEENDLSDVHIESSAEEVIDQVFDIINDNIGVEHGQTCPVCKAGTVIESGGCNTCNNCKIQLKCGI